MMNIGRVKLLPSQYFNKVGLEAAKQLVKEKKRRDQRLRKRISVCC